MLQTPKSGMDVLQVDCDPVKGLCWNRLLEGSVDLWREDSMLELFFWQDL